MDAAEPQMIVHAPSPRRAADKADDGPPRSAATTPLSEPLADAPAADALTTGLGDIMGMSHGGLARFGRFAPLERVLLTANGNLQRIVSSYYDAPVRVEVLRCVEKEPRGAGGSGAGEPSCVAAFDREVNLLVSGRVFCVAQSDVRLHTPEALEAVSSGAVGLGQVWMVLVVLLVVLVVVVLLLLLLLPVVVVLLLLVLLLVLVLCSCWYFCSWSCSC